MESVNAVSCAGLVIAEGAMFAADRDEVVGVVVVSSQETVQLPCSFLSADLTDIRAPFSAKTPCRASVPPGEGSCAGQMTRLSIDLLRDQSRRANCRKPHPAGLYSLPRLATNKLEYSDDGTVHTTLTTSLPTPVCSQEDPGSSEAPRQCLRK